MQYIYYTFLCIAIKDLLPDILTHLGPKQLGALSQLIKKPEDEIKESPGDEEEDVPSLVNQDFEEASKKQQ